ncbi:hypothetical protein BDD12DRAFT_892097 [Trichophaea hybrida]|nr:hypothetical protein BDD12DRAFT_892097 [Trichophaea hybrida]
MARRTVKICLVHWVAPAEQRFHHEQQLKQRLRDYIHTSDAKESSKINEEKVNLRIHVEKSRGRTYAIPKTETEIIIYHIWDLGFSGTNIANIYRTNRETKEMFDDHEQDTPALATGLSGILDAFKNRTGTWDTMAEHGLYPEDDSEDVEEEF